MEENNNTDPQVDPQVDNQPAVDNTPQQNNILSGEGGTPDDAKTLTIPGENATDDEKNAFYTALGRPENAEGYEINKPEDLPVGVGWMDEEVNAFKEFAFANGLSQAQAAEAVKFQVEMVKRAQAEALAAHNALAEQNIADLQKEWGADYDSKIAAANNAVKIFGVAEALTKANLLADKSIVKAFAKIGESISEAKIVNGANSATAEERYNELVNDKNSAYYNLEDPKHKEAVREVVNYLQNKK